MTKNRVLTLCLIGLLSLTLGSVKIVQASELNEIATINQAENPVVDAKQTASFDKLTNTDLDKVIQDLIANQAPTQTDEIALLTAISVRSQSNHDDPISLFWSTIDLNQKQWVNQINDTNYTINTKNTITETLNTKLDERKDAYDTIGLIGGFAIVIGIPLVLITVLVVMNVLLKQKDTRKDVFDHDQ